MSLFSVVLKTKIFDMCIDALFDGIEKNMRTIKTLILKEGDHFSEVSSSVHDVVNFTDVDIIEVGPTYVVFEGDSETHGNDVTAVIKAKNHESLMGELSRWDFVP